MPAPVTIDGSEDVMAVVRSIPGDTGAAAVVHLLNRRYDGERDAMVPQQRFTVRLRADLFGEREFAKATLHVPKTEPLPLEMNADGDYYTLKIPELMFWGIVELAD